MTDGMPSPTEVRGAVLKSLWDMGKMVAAFVVSAVALWQFSGETLREFVALPDRVTGIEQDMAEMRKDLAILSGREPTRPVVEFRDGAIVIPSEVRAGSVVTVVYNLRRNDSCSTQVERRFWNVSEGAYDARFTMTTPAIRANRAEDFGPFKFKLSVPDLPPGEWAYHPALHPGADCEDRRVVQAPLAYFRVLDAP